MPIRPALRSTFGFLTSFLFLLSGCSRTVTVPTRELVPASEWKGRYRITTTAESFAAREFAVTDSTIVITKLAESDERYGRADLPVTLVLDDVQSIERTELDRGKSALPVLVVFVVGLFVLAASSIDLSAD